MSKEVEQEGLSIKVPFITEEEIRYVDNNMETIVNTLTKQIIRDKDLAIAQHIIQRLQEKNEANKKRIEELEEENKKISKANEIYIKSIQNIAPVLSNDYIEKSLLKETLEKLQAEYKIALEENSTRAFILKCQTEILQELLKDEGE